MIMMTKGDVASFVLAASALLVGCSGSNSSSGGTNAGNSGPYDDALWFQKSSGKFEIHLSTYTGQCALRQAGAGKANSRILELDLTPATGQTAVPAGTYTVMPNETAGNGSASYKVFDSTCNETKIVPTGGSITLDSPLDSSGSQISGSYNIQFQDGSSQAGTFSAALCADSSSGTAGPACAP